MATLYIERSVYQNKSLRRTETSQKGIEKRVWARVTKTKDI